MKKGKICFWQLCIGLFLTLIFFSCVEEETFSDNPKGNFQALWKVLDEHYCFFPQKGIDWKSVYDKYEPRFNDEMSERQQFDTMAEMLSELRDGHVNLYSTFNTARYWAWRDNFQQNYSDSLERVYLGKDYGLVSGLQYKILDDSIAYLRCESFKNGISGSSLNEILLYFKDCKGLIIDVRNNGGGALTNAEKLAARFTDKELLVGYMQHKTGRGHADFSPLKPQMLSPGKGVIWLRKTIVLTNRSVYSSANEFVKYMKCCPNVRIVGDRTGGGSGLPFSSELPNGWSVRFSACPMYDRDKAMTEFGIDPDFRVNLSADDFKRKKDTIIEFAKQLITLQGENYSTMEKHFTKFGRCEQLGSE
ncbi:MAG: S41 family peptidase [Prevotella sp.]|nr:S41 family peptidase [Prevotellaceae bacterium]MDY3936290.1 S41 family peptidase [Prevotella sp.]